MSSVRGADDSANKRNLSKNVLQMKFMQKGKVQIIDEKEEMARRIQRNKEHWVIGNIADQPKKLPYHFDTSVVVCEDLLPIGRMAFLNFNPLVDRTHKELLGKTKTKHSTEREDYDAISDEEMAERYESLVHTIDKKFQKKRKRDNEENSDSDESDEELKILDQKAKRRFLKPKIE